MTTVYLSLGSNIDARSNIVSALDVLESRFGKIQCSPVYESEAVGFQGDNFLNLVVRLDTLITLKELVQQLKHIEERLGRERSGPKFSSRVIDIDVIFFGNACGDFDGIELPRYEIYENAYVLLPMSILAPDFVDPKSGLSIKALWESSNKKMQEQKLWTIVL